MAPFQIRFGFHSTQQTNTQPTDYNSELESEEEEEEESEHEEEEEEEEEELPISSPLICPAASEGVEDRGGSPSTGQFSVFEMLVAAVRKSLVMCSVGAELEEGAAPPPRSSMDISWPTDVRHVAHVTFDPFDGFLGLPSELEPELPTQIPSASVSVFGVSPNSMQCSIDKRGNSIPTILLSMQRHLYQNGGLQAEGIFRINAENGQEVEVREQLNTGIVPDSVDLHCLAGLIKAWFRELPSDVLDTLTPEQVMQCNTEDECAELAELALLDWSLNLMSVVIAWFRELPAGVLDALTPEEVMQCNTEEECAELARNLPPAELALLDWAVNLMADVVQHERFNKMNARSVAMVFAPNMTQMADPLTALIHAVQVMNFLKTLILKTIREREESLTASGSHTSCSDSPNDSNNNNEMSNVINIEKKDNNQDFPTIDRTTFDFDNLVNVDCEVKGFDNDENNNSERFSFRKGVVKFCRHPVFQLSRSMKKNGEIDSNEGRQAWV